MAHQTLTPFLTPLLRRLSAWPASCASAFVALVSFVPILFGQRYLGLDHSRVLLSMMCGGRGDDGAILDASFGGGGPLLEEPQGLVLYPTSWLLRVLDVELAASLFVVLHLALAAAGAAHLARAKGITRAHAFAFGVAFATCGTVLDLILHGPYLVGAAGLALTWAGVARLLSRRAALGGALLITCGPALLLLSGELQGFGIALAIVVVEVGAAALVRRRNVRNVRDRWRGMALVAGAFASGALIGGAQLALSIALASATSRSSRVPDPFHWSLTPAQLLGVVWPGDLIARAADGSSLYTANLGDAMARPPWNLTPFLGAPVLALAIVAIAFCARRPRARWRMVTPSLVAVFATLFALGDRTPILAWAIAVVPPLGFFRYPAKYFVVASLALLLLAFHVIALAASSRAAPKFARIARIALAAAAAACACGVVVAFALHDRVDALGGAVAVRPPWPGEATLGGLLLARAVLAFALALLVLLVAFARPRALALVVALGLVIPFARGLPVGEPLTSLPPRTAGAWGAGVPRAKDALVCHGRAIGARHVDRPGEPLGIEGDMIVDWLDLKPNMNQCQDIAVPHAAMASSQGPTFTLATTLDETAPLPVQAWALGCTHIATRAPFAAIAHVVVDGAPVAPPVAGVDAPVFAMRAPAVDIAIARTPTLYANGEDALAALSAMRSPEDVANVIDDPTRVLAGRTLPPFTESDLNASVAWSATTSGRVKLSGGRGGAVIALRRPWWPGFEAMQGETRVPVVRAAGVQLTVVVDDVTRGDIMLTYRVRNAPIALASFVMGVLLLFGVVVVIVRRTKRGTG